MSPQAAVAGASALTAVFVAGYLYASYHQAKRWAWACKPAASLCFVALSWLLTPADPTLAAWLRAGLILSAVGDVALLDRSRRGLTIGLGAFLLGHVAYCVGFAPRVPPTALTALLCGLALAGGGWIFAQVRPYLGRLRIPAAVYTLAVAATCGLGLAAWSGQPGDPGHVLLGLGALLFFLSDVSVAWLRFLQASFAHRLWGLPCYYAGQLLLASSLAWVGAA